ncbi:MAG: hypothetical protein ABIJ96_13650, partial [Elusimicrobiota bacterium]
MKHAAYRRRCALAARFFPVIPSLFLAACAIATPKVRLASDELGMRLTRPAHMALTLAYSPTGNHVAAGTATGDLHLWDVAAGRKLWTVKA